MEENNRKIYQEEICHDCLHKLVNDEGDHTEEGLQEMNETLEKWADEGYYPAGLTEDLEPHFSHIKCILCSSLAGDRYSYNFFTE